MRRWLIMSLLLTLPVVASIAAETQGLNALVRLLSESDDAQLQQDILIGIAEGLEGRRHVEMPEAWPAASSKLQRSATSEVRDRAIQLALVFDDPDAIRLLRDRAMNVRASAEDRIRAVELLVAKKNAGFDALLVELIADPVTRRAAVRGLAEYDHPQTVVKLLESYSHFDTACKQDVLQTLASKRTWAARLLDAVEADEIASSDLNAYTVRQLHSLGSSELTARVRSLWGEVRSTPADKATLIARYKEQLTGKVLAGANLSAGRGLFDRTCANCHKLFGEGKQVGPDITGSQRTNLDYLLQNLIDPSGAVSKDYQMHIVATTGGRVITGLLVSENEQALTLQTVNERIVLPLNEIEERSLSSVSMMPDGQLQKLSSAEMRDLIAYLGSRVQIPLSSRED
ncbi:MAG: c-type cytochrome [Planctomycetota bacterium]|nr:c-type cytochrome [Planctomycetota bacterium]